MLAYLKEAVLFGIHVIEWNVSHIGLLVYKHGVSLAKRPTSNVLTTDSYVEPYTARFTRLLFAQYSAAFY